jgi:transcriptional regulator with XRE-family HTH domain
MADTPDSFGLRLRELREQAGLTREGLADQAGMKIGGVRDLEQDRRRPSWDTALALAAALGVTPNDFLTPASADVTPRGRGRPPKLEPPPTRPKGKKK